MKWECGRRWSDKGREERQRAHVLLSSNEDGWQPTLPLFCAAGRLLMGFRSQRLQKQNSGFLCVRGVCPPLQSRCLGGILGGARSLIWTLTATHTSVPYTGLKGPIHHCCGALRVCVSLCVCGIGDLLLHGHANSTGLHKAVGSGGLSFNHPSPST